MLSILIPTYHYNALPLVISLHQQALKTGVTFEIICFDDGSNSKDNIANEKMNDLPHAYFKSLPENVGRSAIRNLLGKKAKYQQLLFLDADTMPIHSTFIEKYVAHLQGNSGVIYGGIKYQKEKPHPDQLLRWIYGNKREALPVNQRIKHPYISLLTLNFVVAKKALELYPFNENIPNLRHEDTLFALQLQSHNVPISHIDNPALHLGLETSTFFLKKSLESVEVLHFFLEKKLISTQTIKLTRIASQLKNLKCHRLILLLFNILKPYLQKNITSRNPSLLVFDCYRLGHFFKTEKK